MLRPDRMASVYFWGPLARLHRARSSFRIPILMYHSVSENLFGKSHPYYQINTSPKMFAQQMKYLRDAGYKTVVPADFVEGTLPTRRREKLVSITFDDGYRDFYTHAFPILRRYGFSAIIYLATGRVRKVPEVHEGVEYLCWDEVREMHRNSIHFGSHTVTHPDLRSLGPEQIEYELGSSKETIESELGTCIDSFAYPYAFPEEDTRFSRYFRDQLETHGYTTQVTTILGTATAKSDVFFLPRLPANTWDDPAFFKTKLEGGYDWLHWPQKLYKVTHHHMTLMQRAANLEAGETD
jgi:peptidoglycan/xylan/chitin deacetylase (PgdA/CDA1 family)